MLPASEGSGGLGGGLKRTPSRGKLSLGGDDLLGNAKSHFGQEKSGQLSAGFPKQSLAANASSSLPLKARTDEFPPFKQQLNTQPVAPTESKSEQTPVASSPRPGLLKRSRSMGTFDHLVAPEVSDGQKAVEAITGKVTIGQPSAGGPSVGPAIFSQAVPLPDFLQKPPPQAKQPQVKPQPQPQAQPQVQSPQAEIQTQPKQGERARSEVQQEPRLPRKEPSAPAPVYAKPREARSPSPHLGSIEDGQDSPRGMDDSNLHHEPLTRVDYFSHDWTERDIADSWRYIVSRRQDMANSARLENASWRMWAKAKNHLRTVSPEEVNWLKDYDVTWLYGPLYHDPHMYDTAETTPSEGRGSSVSAEPSDLRSQSSERTNVATAGPSSGLRGLEQKKPKSILKKKTFAQLMLEDAPELAMGEPGSAADYLRHHHYRPTPMGSSRQRITDLLNTQYSKHEHPQSPVSTSPANGLSPSVSHHALSSTNSMGSLNSMVSRFSVTSSNSPHERRVHFNDRVEQCIAIDPDEKAAADATTRVDSVFGSSTESEDEDYDEYSSGAESDENSGLFLGLRRPSTVDESDSSIIASLPATTLKYQADQEESEEEPQEYVPQAATRVDNSHSQRRPGFNANYDYRAVFRAPANNSVYEIVDPNVKPVDLVASSSSASPEHEKVNPAELPLATEEQASTRTKIRPVASFGV